MLNGINDDESAIDEEEETEEAQNLPISQASWLLSIPP